MGWPERIAARERREAKRKLVAVVDRGSVPDKMTRQAAAVIVHGIRHQFTEDAPEHQALLMAVEALEDKICSGRGK